jgi:hypothetical protein
MVEVVRESFLDAEGFREVDEGVGVLREGVRGWSVDDVGVNALLDVVLESAKGRMVIDAKEEVRM